METRSFPISVYKLDKADLCRIVRVCRTWKDVAEAFLWKYLPRLDPLLRLLPEDAWTMEAVTKDQIYHWDSGRALAYTLRRALVPGDWATFQHYGKFVQSASMNAGQSESTGFDYVRVEDQWRIVQCPPLRTVGGQAKPDAEHSPEIPVLLPHLRSLFIKADTHGTIVSDFLALLLSPTITFLDVTDVRYCWSPAYWKMVVDRCPRLETLHLSDFARTKDAAMMLSIDEFLHSLFEALSMAQCLTDTHLNISFRYSDALVLALAACPALTMLSFRMDGYNVDFPRPIVDIPCRSFQSLKVILCTRAPAQLVTAIITSGHNVPLEIIELEDCALMQDELVSLTAALRDHCDRRALTMFSLSCSSSGVIVQKEALAPLTAFGNLTSVSIKEIADAVIDVADFEDLAGCWPLLHEFTLSAKTPFPLAVVGTLARLCPRLIEISIPLDATVVPSVEGIVGVPRVGSAGEGGVAPVTLFPPDWVPIADAEEVARYLQTVFPGSSVTVDQGLDDMGDAVLKQWGDTWDRVNEITENFVPGERW